MGRRPVAPSTSTDRHQEFKCESGGAVSCHVSIQDSETAAGPQRASVSVTADFLQQDNSGKAVLHWGRVPHGGGEWSQPDNLLPAGTKGFGDQKAGQTVFEGKTCKLEFSVVKDADEAKGTIPPMAPEAIAFVIKHYTASGDERWDKQEGGSDFLLDVQEPPKQGSSMSQEKLDLKFSEPEAEFENWSQFQRFCLAMEFTGKGYLTDEEASWVTTSLRCAKMRKLDWFRKYNYQPKDFVHVQERLSVTMVDAINNSANSYVTRAMLRLALTYIPRGGSSNGDSIRMTILNIMRDNGIREGHRPGIEDRFLEQWHQKLHTNTAADDITICEAHIAFLDSGNIDDFWNHMARENLTRERLRNMPHPITADPLHLGQLRGAMQDFLNLLKSVHSGADMDFLADTCRGQISGEACTVVHDVLHNRHAWWTPGAINGCRKKLASDRWKRDVMMLDCVLEGWQVLKIGALDVEHSVPDDVIGIISVLLESLCISRADERISAAFRFFERVRDANDCQKWSEEWSRRMMAALDRVGAFCVDSVDRISNLMQSNADSLRKRLCEPSKSLERWGPDDMKFFGEETARSLPELQLSRMIGTLSGHLRKAAKLAPWEVVSSPVGAVIVGTAMKIKTLSDLEGSEASTLPARVVACCTELSMWDNIPPQVVAILVPPGKHLSLLSHVAIRARCQKVLMAACVDQEVWNAAISPHFDDDDKQPKKELEVIVNAKGEVQITEPTAPSPQSPSTAESPAVATPVTEGRPQQSTETLGAVTPAGSPAFWSPSTAASSPADLRPSEALKAAALKGVKLVLSAAEYEAERNSIGGKSLNLSELATASSEFLRPSSVTIPFGVFERELSHGDNATLKQEVETLKTQAEKAANATERSQICEKLRSRIVGSMAISDELVDLLYKKLAEAELDKLAVDVDELLDGVRRVWASKYTERAVSSRVANRIPDSSLYMGVLVQNVIEADYAFVIHTKNPQPTAVADSAEETVVELVCGMGEPLVSNSAGKALGAFISKSESKDGDIDILISSYPSKGEVVKAPSGGSLICRSDSNGEDLADFAGAGLYDSFTVKPCKTVAADYSDEKMIHDEGFRKNILAKLYRVGEDILAQKKVHQDIEGCIVGEQVYVVQVRPQML